MKKLYKYRPLSAFTFKELLYQELYFASHNELNDPLDLHSRIDFSIENEEDADYISYHILRSTTNFGFDTPITDADRINNTALFEFNSNEDEKKKFDKAIFNSVQQQMKIDKFIDFDQLCSCIRQASSLCNIPFKINYNELCNRIEKVTDKFLKNSYATCFSETNTNFLMWSHYASNHTGICLEFSLLNGFSMAYLRRKRVHKKEDDLKQRMKTWESEQYTFWDRIKSVTYSNEQPSINFIKFAPIFEREYDCDVIGISKSWVHHYAYELENCFATKTKPWEYEKEWRAIEINFGNSKTPEQRIRHYPIEILSGIYFGSKTSEIDKERIYDIMNEIDGSPTYYDSILNGSNNIEFVPWETSREE